MKKNTYFFCVLITGLLFLSTSCSNTVDLTVKPTLFVPVSDIEMNVDNSQVVRFFGGEDGIYKIVPDTSDIVDIIIDGNKIKFIGKQEGKQHFEVYANKHKIDFDVIVNQPLPLGVIVLDSTLTSWPASAVPLDSIVRIPLSVKYIGNDAMRSHEDGPGTTVVYSDLKEVYIPNSVVSIGSNAFSYGVADSYYDGRYNFRVYDSLPLYKVHIGDNVRTIGDYAFAGNLKLRDIALPNVLEKLGKYALAYTAIESMKVPDLITKLEDGVFAYCNKLKSVEILGNIKSIGNETFYGCEALPSITIPNTVESIGNYAFWDCASLSSISLPSSLKSLDNDAFARCKSLSSITLPKSLESIDYSAFLGCSSLTNLVIPNKVKLLNNFTFSGCSNLVNITLSESLDSLGLGVFAGCAKLTNLVLPNSLEKIGMAAFAGCSSLTSIKIPEGVKTISTGTFANCANLTTIELPSTIKYLTGGVYKYRTESQNDDASVYTGTDGSLFGGCSKLTKIICRSVEPFKIKKGSRYVDTIGQSYYDSMYVGPLKNITLYVPAGSVEAYKQMMRDLNAGEPEQYQNNFADILPIPDGE